MNQLIVAVILSSLGIVSISCQTTSYLANVDSRRKVAVVQSQADLGSPIFTLQNKGALDSLKSALKQKLSEKPRDVKSLVNLSQVYLAQGNTAAAEKVCKQALKYDLNNKNAKLVLAQIYYRKGYIDMTEIILNGLGDKVQKDSIALNLKALIALENDRPSLGMFFFKQALRFNPSDVATRMNLGVLYVYYRQVDSAAIQFERVLKIMPDHVDAKLHLAVVKSARGNNTEAESLYKSVLAVDSDNALATYNLAVLEEKRSNLDESLTYVRKYLGSDYAKEHNNKEVFAMIERLRAKKDMKGENLSDAEIKDLAAQLEKPSRVNVAKSDEAGDEFIRKAPKLKNQKPKAKKNKTVVKKTRKKAAPIDDDDIESLEKALFE